MKFIVNLNGIILCPYQILLDIAEQIPNCPPRIKNLAFAPICDLNSTNDWINLESLGKPVAIRAKAICDIVSTLLKNQNEDDLSLDIYLKNGLLSSDNLYSLLFLAQSFNSLELTFFIDAQNVVSLQSTIEYLIVQEHLSIHFNTDNDWSTLNVNEGSLTHLKNTRQCVIKGLGFDFEELFLSHEQIDDSLINQLIGFAWVCLKSGGYEIACQLLEKAIGHSAVSVAMQEQLFMHLLMVRFFSHQYALITESEFPEQFSTLQQSEIKTLHFFKAYSATLSRNLSVAQEFFKKCNITEQMPINDESTLYQLNLFALFKVLQGEIDTAFALEFRIKNYIEEHNIDTVGLNYVNSINIARLYKKIKEYDHSLEYYNRAYNELSGGGYTTSDHIYYNMNLGSLHEAAGNPEQALQYWIKAAIYWLACKNKYELSWRPRLILCNEKISDVSKPLPIEKANVFLLNKIKELIQICGIEITSKSLQGCQFTDDSLSIKKEHCLIYKNIVLYTNHSNEHSSLKRHSLAEEQLSMLVLQYINTVMSIPDSQNVFIIDTQMDDTVLSKAEEAMAFANLYNCLSCNFNGQLLDLENLRLKKPIAVSLSRVIESIAQAEKGLSVHYKRSFLNKTLVDQAEINWVNQLKQNSTLNLEHITNIDWIILHQLEKKRILNFSYSV